MTHEKLLKLNGKKVIFTCQDVRDTGVISVENDSIYICQNIMDGEDCENKYGYKYSWFIGDSTDNYEEGVLCFTKIKPIKSILKKFMNAKLSSKDLEYIKSRVKDDKYREKVIYFLDCWDKACNFIITTPPNTYYACVGIVKDDIPIMIPVPVLARLLNTSNEKLYKKYLEFSAEYTVEELVERFKAFYKARV